ncbi:hypothetical protein [Kocuria sp. KH4]
MGSAKVSVVVLIDLDGTQVRLVVTGPLTLDTQATLHPLIRRARALTPATRVVVDLTGARITEADALDVLVHRARAGHTGHPSRQVRFTLPAAMTRTDAEDLERLRAEQRSWTAPGGPLPPGPVHSIGSAPARPHAVPITAPVRERRPAAFPPRRTPAARDHSSATTPQPAAGAQRTTAAAPATGVVLPFRPPPRRRSSSTPRLAPSPPGGVGPDQGA